MRRNIKFFLYFCVYKHKVLLHPISKFGNVMVSLGHGRTMWLLHYYVIHYDAFKQQDKDNSKEGDKSQ